MPNRRPTHKIEYLTIPEAAKALGISRVTAYRYVKSGKLPATRVGGKIYLIPRAHLDPVARPITARRKRQIERVVDRVVKEYGDVLQRLADE